MTYWIKKKKIVHETINILFKIKKIYAFGYCKVSNIMENDS